MTEFNLRFPGQYFDKETNTHYNYFRDYDPAIGRYVQSDPIGLSGGLNTFAYVANDPLRWTDSNGLLVGGPPLPNFGIACGWKLYQSEKGKFPPGANDTYKHCVLSCKIAIKCGTFASAIGGIGKEISDLFGPGIAEWRDIIANYRGIQCSWQVKSGAKDPDDQCKGLTCEKCCEISGY